MARNEDIPSAQSAIRKIDGLAGKLGSGVALPQLSRTWVHTLSIENLLVSAKWSRAAFCHHDNIRALLGKAGIDPPSVITARALSVSIY